MTECRIADIVIFYLTKKLYAAIKRENESTDWSNISDRLQTWTIVLAEVKRSITDLRTGHAMIHKPVEILVFSADALVRIKHIRKHETEFDY